MTDCHPRGRAESRPGYSFMTVFSNSLDTPSWKEPSWHVRELWREHRVTATNSTATVIKLSLFEDKLLLLVRGIA